MLTARCHLQLLNLHNGIHLQHFDPTSDLGVGVALPTGRRRGNEAAASSDLRAGFSSSALSLGLVYEEEELDGTDPTLTERDLSRIKRSDCIKIESDRGVTCGSHVMRLSRALGRWTERATLEAPWTTGVDATPQSLFSCAGYWTFVPDRDCFGRSAALTGKVYAQEAERRISSGRGELRVRDRDAQGRLPSRSQNTGWFNGIQEQRRRPAVIALPKATKPKRLKTKKQVSARHEQQADVESVAASSSTPDMFAGQREGASGAGADAGPSQ